jgi:hypothetical protein
MEQSAFGSGTHHSHSAEIQVGAWVSRHLDLQTTAQEPLGSCGIHRRLSATLLEGYKKS